MALTAHVTSSVGWLGAVAGFLGLAVVRLTSQDAETVRGAYLIMEPTAWFVLVPLAMASLLTGLLQSLGTTWGLFRHYWVLFKLFINVVATTVLLIYIDDASVHGGCGGRPERRSRRGTERIPLLHAVAALLLLLAATTLAVFKPRGMTRYGRRNIAKSS